MTTWLYKHKITAFEDYKYCPKYMGFMFNAKWIIKHQLRTLGIIGY